MHIFLNRIILLANQQCVTQVFEVSRLDPQNFQGYYSKLASKL